MTALKGKPPHERQGNRVNAVATPAPEIKQE